MVWVRVAFHENDGNHENDENDEDNSDSYKQGVECWIRGNHGNHENGENHENPGCKPRVPQTTGLEIPDKKSYPNTLACHGRPLHYIKQKFFECERRAVGGPFKSSSPFCQTLQTFRSQCRKGREMDRQGGGGRGRVGSQRDLGLREVQEGRSVIEFSFPPASQHPFMASATGSIQRSLGCTC